MRALVREHVEMAQDLAARVKTHPKLALVVEPPLNLVCIAHKDGDDATQQLIDAVNRDGRFFVSHCRFHGKLVLRVSIGALATTRAHVAALTTLLCAEADRA
jgi:aromatic-L-amino-acid decarboxylase